MESALCISCNEAKYDALIVGLRLAKKLGVQNLKIFNDSQLIFSRVLKNYQAREENMRAYLQKVEELLGHFTEYKVE